MNKEKKSMSKKMKIILVLVVAFVLLGSTSGIVFYANTINVKVNQTQTAYHSLTLPNTEQYNVVELAEFNTLQEQKQKAFDTLDVETLNSLQTRFNTLDIQVTERIKEEQLTKQYADKEIEIEAITILDGANEGETTIFNVQKQHAINMVTERKTFDIIIDAINQLHQTNTNIQTRKDADAQAQVSQSSGSYTYDNSDDYDYDYDDSYSGGGSGDTGGGSTPPADDSDSPVPPGWGAGCDANSCWGDWR